MKRLFILVLSGLFFLSVFSAPALAGEDTVKVMTRNQYLGANLTPLILAQNPADFIAAATDALNTIAANNFPLRARRLATEVALTKPQLIGLQEVFNFTLNGDNVGPPFVDHLAETLAALDDKGQSYEVAAILNNLDITVDIQKLGSVRVLDRDVILCRKDIRCTPLIGNFIPDGPGGLCGVPIENPAFGLLGPKFLKSTPSEDGCNYTILAEVESPVGTITIERGFVGVDATVQGNTFRFVNTHLEEAEPDPSDPGSAIFQSLQSLELVGSLLAITPSDLPLIVVGDFNSSPEDMPIGPIVPPYQIIVDAGFSDVWDTNPLKFFDQNGFTCCQDDNLLNTTSLLDERIDIIFVRDSSFLPLAFVTGRVPLFPLSQPPNWASDHGGVFGKLIFR